MGQRIRRFFIYIILLIITAGFFYFFTGKPDVPAHVTWGVTFSKNYAEHLGLDWKKTYLAILDDLKVSHIRIAIPWNDVEPREGEFQFEDYHYLFSEAEKRNVVIIPVLGERTPRWPECHTPVWAKDLTDDARGERVVSLVEKEMEEFKRYEGITFWQIENEPYLRLFGECKKINRAQLVKEIEHARSIDSRPILLTDSGEFGWWYMAAKDADILGITMYRWVWNSWFDYMKYPLPPMYYYRRAQLISRAHPNIRMIGSELQMEPWTPDKNMVDTPIETQKITMNVEQFRDNIEFAKQTGIDTHYLWGVEWWYWMKEQKGDSSYWNEAAHLWSK